MMYITHKRKQITTLQLFLCSSLQIKCLGLNICDGENKSFEVIERKVKIRMRHIMFQDVLSLNFPRT